LLVGVATDLLAIPYLSDFANNTFQPMTALAGMIKQLIRCTPKKRKLSSTYLAPLILGGQDLLDGSLDAFERCLHIGLEFIL
jgi:hypothetical protein